MTVSLCMCMRFVCVCVCVPSVSADTLVLFVCFMELFEGSDCPRVCMSVSKACPVPLFRVFNAALCGLFLHDLVPLLTTALCKSTQTGQGVFLLLCYLNNCEICFEPQFLVLVVFYRVYSFLWTFFQLTLQCGLMERGRRLLRA